MKRLFALVLVLWLLTGCVALPPQLEQTVPTLETTSPTVATIPTDPTDPTAPSETTAPTETLAPTEATQPTEPAPNVPPSVDSKTPADDDFVRVLDYIPDAVIELKYATTDNFTGQVIYTFTEAYLRYSTVKRLMAVQETLKANGFRLKIWDAYRPVYGQQALWDAYPDSTFVSNPTKGVRAHCRGNTVDISMTDAEGNDVEMPTAFDNFTALADRDYSDCSAAAAANAKLLEETMYANGFTGYSKEWWHYIGTEEYEIEYVFDPAVVSTWYATCNQSMSLRTQPDGGSSSIQTIYPNETVTLLGWSGKFAYVDYAGYRGYVLADYISPVQSATVEDLSVVTTTSVYTYEQMQQDLEALCAKYPNLATLSSIGTSENGQQIPVLILGDPQSENQILIQAGIHGREHMTSWLVTALADYCLTTGAAQSTDACFHIIPMTNPDGIAISQSQTLPQELQSVYKSDIRLGYTDLSASRYAAQWKANAKGVDLNRNFDAGWQEFLGRNEPSSERYKGTEPFSATEAEALRQYTLSIDFDATVSYHATGSIIYSTSGSNKTVNKQSLDLATRLSRHTGYGLGDLTSVDRAGYKDWAGDVLGIPSITVEIGSESTPLALRELESIFARNLEVFRILAAWPETL